MAILIPSNRSFEEFNGSIGEKHLYDQFKFLSNDFIIYHSLRWMKNKNGPRFGESDYLIFHKNYGLISLEVKHGAIKSRDGRVIQINRKSGKEFYIDPIGQANRTKYYFIDLLQPLFNQYNFRIPVHSAVWFTGINKNDVKGKLPNDYAINGNTFFYDDINNINQVFKKSFKFFQMNEQQLPKLILNKIRDCILPDFEAFPGMSNIVNQNEYVFNRMTKEQSYLLDYLEEQKTAAIEGGAGTGKTMLAVEKARRLSTEDKVLFLCYNNFLMENLKEKYKEEMYNVTFTNLHTLAAKALKKNVSNEDIKYFLENFNLFPEVWNFDSIIIDEGQDFSNEQIKLIKDISILIDGSFYVFYDKNQLVQQRHELEWLNSMDCRLILSYNCRNTLSIAKTSSNPIGIEKVKMRYDIKGEIPMYHNTSNKDELVLWLKKRIDIYISDGLDISQIVILTTKTMEKSSLNDIKKIGKYNLSYSINESGILFTTARKYKGLEADVILVIDADAQQFDNKESRRVFYVAASRAKSFLEIITCLSDIEEEEMFYSLSNGRSKNIMNLVTDLNVKPI